MFIRADENGTIQVISVAEFDGYTCEVEQMPDDFNKYLKYNKYRANGEGLYISDGWVDFEPDFWHEPEKHYKVFLKYEDSARLNIDFPEMGVYRKENGIFTYTVVDGICMYVNWILDAHKELLLLYNAIITENEII